MTDNQFNQLFDLVTKSVTVTQAVQKDVSALKEDVSALKEDVAVLKEDVAVLKTDMSEVKADIAELKTGQNRIEKQLRLNNAAVIEIAGEHFEIKGRVTDLEKATY